MTRGLFGRLLVSMCGVAAASTALALLLQERSLSSDLERAAERRLATAATAADRLVDAHLDAVAARYRAVSGAPQFRATLEVDHAPTLAHYAESLRDQHRAARIAFVDAQGEVAAAAGPEALDRASLAVTDQGLVAHAGSAYVVVSVPIARAGRLVAVEPVTGEMLEAWSDLCGARVSFAAPADGPAHGLRSVPRRVGDLEMSVSYELDAEAAAMRTARANLATAGAVALGLALLASLVVSRGLVRPIQRVQEAAHRIGGGDLSQSASVDLAAGRGDEIGDVARAFEEMSAGLRATVERVIEAADRVDATASLVSQGAARFIEVSREQQAGAEEATTTLSGIEARVSDLAGSAGHSAVGIDRAVEESGAAFRDLADSGESLEEGAALLWSQTEEISQAMESLVASAMQMAEDSDGLLPSVEATAQSVDQMAAVAGSVNEHAGETRRLSDRVVASADEARQVVRDAVAGMEATLETIGASESVIEGLHDRAGEIGKILTVIGDVTDETGLLALNASIVAAQAGERGKAFGVVAGQMKALAQRVSASTREIEAVVGAVQAESAAAVTSIAAGSARAGEGAALMGRAEVALARISDAARETGERMGESTRATAEQIEAAAAVTKQMEAVSLKTARIREAARAQADANATLQHATESLRGVARDVRMAVDKQTHGASRIGASVEAVKGAVAQVAEALEAQGAASRQVAAVIRRSVELGRSHESSADEMGEAARHLGAQAEAMRAAVGRFRI